MNALPDMAVDATDQERRRIRDALRYLQENFQDQPTLEDVAAQAGLSPYHFQRLFTRFVGISPKKFVQHLSLERAKQSLRNNASVLDATFDAGLSGPGRLHDLFVTHEALTPGEWKTHADGVHITYGWHPSPFGDCLIMATPRGVCGLGFADEEGREAAVAELAEQLELAELDEDTEGTARFADLAFGRAKGELHLMLRGSPFQIKVWRALLRIPPGDAASYKQIAMSIGQPTAARAVGRACGTNPIPWIIPCHCVLRADGALWGYRWGNARKRLMLAWEAAVAEELGQTA